MAAALWLALEEALDLEAVDLLGVLRFLEVFAAAALGALARLVATAIVQKAEDITRSERVECMGRRNEQIWANV